MIKIESLKKEFVNDELVTKVLHGIDLEIKKGEFVSIMGPSGSGKSTLMHILGFLDTLTTGKYYFNGKDVSSLSDDTLAAYRNKEVGFVFQSFNLLPKTSVWDNVRLPLLYNKDKIDFSIVDKVIKDVGLEHRAQHMSNQLSGGEKQRVAIARALVNKPGIIFADEPTGNLDSKSGTQIMELLQDLSDSDKTIILVTHETNTARYADRIIKVKDGLLESDITDFEHIDAKHMANLK